MCVRISGVLWLSSGGDTNKGIEIFIGWDGISLQGLKEVGVWDSEGSLIST